MSEGKTFYTTENSFRTRNDMRLIIHVCHTGDQSFQAINCTDTDSQTWNNQPKIDI